MSANHTSISLDLDSIKPVNPTSPTASRRFEQLGLVAGLLTLLCLFISPQRGFLGLHLAGLLLLTISLGAFTFLILHDLASARWATVFRRIPEAMSATIFPIGAILLISLILGGFHYVFDWTHHSHSGPHADLIAKKSAWLNTPFFMIRAALCLLLWTLLSREIVHCSRRLDQEGQAEQAARRFRLSAAWLVTFALSFSMASFDWIMSIEAHWFSTIFALYNFAGAILGGLAATTLIALLLRKQGLLKQFTNEHLQDLATLLFSFSSVWAYLWFCQYMLIWYSHIPEETVYYMARHSGFWAAATIASLVLNWLIPFFLLMARKLKRDPKVVAVIAILFLLGRWLDLFVMIQPHSSPETPKISLPELAPSIALLSLFALLFSRAFQSATPLPLRDPGLHASLNHQV